MPYCLNKVQGFCPVKIEITQFPDGFRLKTIPCSAALGQIKESPSIPSTSTSTAQFERFSYILSNGYRSFRFAMPAGMIFTKRNENRA